MTEFQRVTISCEGIKSPGETNHGNFVTKIVSPGSCNSMLISMAFSLMFHAHAEPLKPLKAIPAPLNVPQFTCDKVEPVRNCEEVLPRLQAYQTNIDKYEGSIVGYLGDVQSAASNWYEQLSPLEKQTVVIPENFFGVVNDGATDISNVNDMAVKNRLCMKKELDEILKQLQSCKPTSATTSGR